MELILTWIPLGIIMVVGAAFMLALKRSGLSKNQSYDSNRNLQSNYKTNYKRLIQLFEGMSRFPLTSRATNELRQNIAGLSIYTNIEQRVEAARIMASSFVMSSVMFAVTWIVSSADLVLMISMVLLIFIFRRDFVSKGIKKKRLKFWNSMLVSIISLNQEYSKMKDLEAALAKTRTDNRTIYLISNIRHIIKAENSKGQLNYFVTNNPYHITVRFADLVYETYTYGSYKQSENGVDSFLFNLDSIIFDLRTDIDLAKSEKKKFYTVEKLPLVGLVFSIYAPIFLVEMIPGMQFHYDTGQGFVLQMAALAVVVGAYAFATRLNDTDKPQEDVPLWMLNLWSDPDKRRFFETRVNDRKRGRLKKSLDRALSTLTPGMFQLNQAIYMIAGLLITLSVMLSYHYMERQAALHGFEGMTEASMYIMNLQFPDYQNHLRGSIIVNPNPQTQEEIHAYLISLDWPLVSSELYAMSENMYRNQHRFLENRVTVSILIAPIVVGIILGMVPEILLARRKKLVDAEAEIEVLLLQSVAVQLMHTPAKLPDYLLLFASLTTLYRRKMYYGFVRQYNFPEDLKQIAYSFENPDYYLLMEQCHTIHSDMIPPDVFRETANSREYLSEQMKFKKQERQESNLVLLKFAMIAALLASIFFQIMIPLVQFVFEALEQSMGMMNM